MEKPHGSQNHGTCLVSNSNIGLQLLHFLPSLNLSSDISLCDSTGRRKCSLRRRNGRLITALKSIYPIAVYRSRLISTVPIVSSCANAENCHEHLLSNTKLFLLCILG